MELLISFAFIVAFLVAQAYLGDKDIGTKDELRKAADAGLHWELAGKLAIGFDTTGVQVMDRHDEFMQSEDLVITGYSCHFLLRNARGEYMFFLYRHDERPYMKLTSQEVAKARLGERYLPPTPSEH